MQVTIAVEGATDIPVAERLLRLAGLEPSTPFSKGGKAGLDKRLAAYNNAANFTPWLVLRDLDRDADCAPTLSRRLLPTPAPHMRFRIAVRALESWLMADRERLAAYLGVAVGRIPRAPDDLLDPKNKMIDLARRSRNRGVREDMVPKLGSSARVGPAYAARVIEYVGSHWRPEVAARSSDSLRRCIDCLKRWAGATAK